MYIWAPWRIDVVIGWFFNRITAPDNVEKRFDGSSSEVTGRLGALENAIDCLLSGIPNDVRHLGFFRFRKKLLHKNGIAKVTR